MKHSTRDNLIFWFIIGAIFFAGFGASRIVTHFKMVELREEIAGLTEEVVDLSTEMENDDAIFLDIFGQVRDRGRSIQSTAVAVTCYTSTVDQCDLSPHETADGSIVRVGIIAVSNDIRRELGLKMGQRVLLVGYGVFEIRDVMNERWKRRVDIWMQDRVAAELHGVRYTLMKWL